MKNIIFYITVVVLSGIMIVLMMNNQEKPSPKVITVSKSYAYHYDTNQSIEIPIYLNQETHPLSHLDSYSMLYISNIDASKKLEIDLTQVIQGHQESYLNETFFLFTLFFDMPYLNQLFEIKDCFINIILVNDVVYQFEMGSFSLQHLNSSTNHLNWTSLSGLKKENTFLSRLNQIIVEFDQLDQTIEHIEICPHIETSFEVFENHLIIQISPDNYLLDNAPIIITYTNLDQQVIANFKYVIDYHILKESGMLLHLYALN